VDSEIEKLSQIIELKKMEEVNLSVEIKQIEIAKEEQEINNSEIIKTSNSSSSLIENDYCNDLLIILKYAIIVCLFDFYFEKDEDFNFLFNNIKIITNNNEIININETTHRKLIVFSKLKDYINMPTEKFYQDISLI